MPLLQQTLRDVIGGLRSNEGPKRASYVAAALAAVKEEIRSTDPRTKVVAVQKMTYLSMLGWCEATWASFHVIEVISLPRLSQKSIGYHAASQTFTPDVPVLVLITNLVKKDMSSSSPYEAGLAIDCLANIMNADLATALAGDLFALTSCPSSYVRRKSVLAVYQACQKDPDVRVAGFQCLAERVEDPDEGVAAAAVTALCEMAMRDPAAYLPWAPTFYRLLLASRNNWGTIKLVKLFGRMCPLEPRLAKKLVEPLSHLLASTGAKSVVLECVHTVAAGMLQHDSVANLAISKLGEELRAPANDANIRCIALSAMRGMLASHRAQVAAYRPEVARCLESPDLSTRREALALLAGMVDPSSHRATLDALLGLVRRVPQPFKGEAVAALLRVSSEGLYANVGDFRWYVGVLAQLAEAGLHGDEAARQLRDLAMRVDAVRGDVVRAVRPLLADPQMVQRAVGAPEAAAVLLAAAWVTGEYAGLVASPREALEALLQPGAAKLPAGVRAVYVSAVVKVVAASAAASPEQVGELAELVERHLPALAAAGDDIEVRERASQALCLARRRDVRVWRGVAAVVSEELPPLSGKAQRKAQPPEGLDLAAPPPDAWWDTLASSSDDESEAGDGGEGEGEEAHMTRRELLLARAGAGGLADGEAGDAGAGAGAEVGGGAAPVAASPQPQASPAGAALAEHRQRHSPFYLGRGSKPSDDRGEEQWPVADGGAEDAAGPAEPLAEPEPVVRVVVRGDLDSDGEQEAKGEPQGEKKKKKKKKKDKESRGSVSEVQ